ncbi:radical SAM/SPASM domain-containing protein [Dyadobacter bucti]|uniref:radical SAM/SPASM domain-containing protein n=1 Tax=Dyadobacter bucti TaxID=2572203 RepID=UPI001109356F|nr:radical SAM protein [Dyadobacter bucti]
MRTLIPRKAPQLLLQTVDGTHAYAVNCASPHSFRVLNGSQYRILKEINGQDDIDGLARKLFMSPEALEPLLSMLAKSELVRFDNCFTAPRKPSGPKSLNFWIHTTDACNLGCSYCYISTLNTSKGMSDIVKRQLLSKLVETAGKRKIRTVKFRLAGGEPLSQFKNWKRFIPEAAYALQQVGCKLDVAFITNLTILNDDILDFSKEHNITYGISMDGVEQVHDLTRKFRSGVGSFHVVDANLRKLLAHNIPVSVNTVVTNQNLEGLPELTRYLVGLDVPFRYSIVKGEAVNAELLEENLLLSYSIMKEAIETGWQFSRRHQFCDLKPNELGFQTCASGFSGGAIYVDGSFKYCHVHFGDNSGSGRSIFNPDIDLVDMIQQSGQYQEAKSEDCKQCRFRFVCTSGCPVYRENGKDPQCSIYHKFIPLYYELQARERLKLLRSCGKI